MVARLAIKLGVPVFPGTTLTFSGTVTEVDPVRDAAVIDLRASTDLGDHLTGSATLRLPHP